jgi:hypothetical protein
MSDEMMPFKKISAAIKNKNGITLDQLIELVDQLREYYTKDEISTIDGVVKFNGRIRELTVKIERGK